MNLTVRITIVSCLIGPLAPAANAQLLRTVALSDVRPSELPAGVPFDGLGFPVLNNSGQVAFTGMNSLQRPNTIWLEDSGQLRLVAYEGQQVPGAADGVRWAPFASVNLHLNSAGQLLFNETLQGTGLSSPFRPSGLWLYESGAIREIARAGMVPPGTPNGERLVGTNFFVGSNLNSAGEVVFVDSLSDGVTVPPAASGIWVDKLGTLSPIAVTGDQAPGLPNGVTFTQFNLARSIRFG